MRKKLLSLALALVMCLGLTVPAFAVYTLEIEGYTFELSNEPIEKAKIQWPSEGGGDTVTAFTTKTLYIVPDNTTIIYKGVPDGILEMMAWSDLSEDQDVNRFMGAESLQSEVGKPFPITPFLEVYGPDSESIFTVYAIYDASYTDIKYFEGEEIFFAAASLLPKLEAAGCVMRDSNSSAPTTPTVPTPSTGFTDVAATDYFAAPVAWAIEKEITQGTGNNRFSPAQNCTNAQILTFLWRAYGQPEPTIASPFTNSIPEVYVKAAVWAYEKGMVSGTAFDVDKPCTRAMAVTYMWQAAGSPVPSVTASFTDVPADSSYALAVAWAVEKEITKGTNPEGTMFSPDEICNRGQIVTFLHRNLA